MDDANAAQDDVVQQFNTLYADDGCSSAGTVLSSFSLALLLVVIVMNIA